jgi:hypothetical protein
VSSSFCSQNVKESTRLRSPRVTQSGAPSSRSSLKFSSSSHIRRNTAGNCGWATAVDSRASRSALRFHRGGLVLRPNFCKVSTR